MIMENGNSTGFAVSDKADVKSGVGVGGFGLKLQRTQSFPYKMMTMMPHHHHRLFSSTETGDGVTGPTFYNGSNEVGRSVSSIYDAVGAAAGTVAKTLKPFNTSAATAFESQGGMAASLRFPFTSAQWQELERQAMIYKYMMASVPVPHELIIPMSRNLPDSSTSQSNLGRGSCFNLRFSNNTTDPEPGRCRRTDGKKWRCSRDVTPEQKYCERHMNRGRPRSRKPVEVHAANNTTPLIPPSTPATATATATATLPNLAVNTNKTSSYHLGASRSYHQPQFLDKSDFRAPCAAMVSGTSYKDSRYSDWMIKGETVHTEASDQQWQNLMQSKVGLRMNDARHDPKASVFQQHYEQPLNLKLYTDFGAGEGSEAPDQNDQSCLFLNPELASLGEPPNSNHIQTPRRFIDAWSTAGTENITETSNKSPVSSNGKHTLSSLTLSMPGGIGTNEDMNQIQMGLGITDSDNAGGLKSQHLSWMTPVPWIASPPGGPLAEVLRPSTATRRCSSTNSKSSCGGSGDGDGLNLMSDGWVGGGGDAGSPPATTISSPSGVLHKTIASLSDSSGTSSPTFIAAAAKSEIALQWLNHNKSPTSS
ncbi:hypothetical protein HHK36_027391 [Tetracentron sinense]|uniref:Growth-regulating factor n=1 Tax=Tetracentron sinense TaxID=13715 RepID=A0A834YD56_TETSI|nr:hypothetical protein HHK36_027391 [Tetracentron sinense]